MPDEFIGIPGLVVEILKCGLRGLAT